MEWQANHRILNWNRLFWISELSSSWFNWFYCEFWLRSSLDRKILQLCMDTSWSWICAHGQSRQVVPARCWHDTEIIVWTSKGPPGNQWDAEASRRSCADKSAGVKCLKPFQCSVKHFIHIISALLLLATLQQFNCSYDWKSEQERNRSGSRNLLPTGVRSCVSKTVTACNFEVPFVRARCNRNNQEHIISPNALPSSMMCNSLKLLLQNTVVGHSSMLTV